MVVWPSCCTASDSLLATACTFLNFSCCHHLSHHRQEVMMAWYVCVRAFRTQFLKFRYSRIVFEIEVGRLLKCVIFCHAEVSPASDILLVQQVDVMRECIGIGIA